LSARGPRWAVAALGAPLLYWTAVLVARPQEGVLPSLVDLAFHEAGHLAFLPFGSTLHYLGGTIGQLLVPVLLGWYFLKRREEPLGAAFCAWWTGENLAGIARYMADARDWRLDLVGGGDHDWNELFYRFGLLGEDSVRAVSGLTRAAGILTMTAGLLWIGALAARPRISPSPDPTPPGPPPTRRPPLPGRPDGASPPPATRPRPRAS
jgi:hypothetical protein